MARVVPLNYENQRVLSVRVRVLHWLMVLLAGLAAVAVALPSVLTQPTYYTSSAVVRFEPGAFAALIEGGQPTGALFEQQQNLGEVLRLTAFPELRQRGLAYSYPAADQIVITAQALDPARATAIAGAAAEGLTRRLYALEGLPLLREVLGHVDQASLSREPFGSEEDRLLTRLLQTEAIAGVSPQPGERSFAPLSEAQRNAVTRALEVRSDQIAAEQRQATEARQNSRTSAALAEATERLRGANDAQAAVRAVLSYMYDAYDTRFDVYTAAAPAAVVQRPAAATAVPTYDLLKIGIAGAVGLVGGLLAVLIDRQVGILAKLQELWAYRELIRNMVARDLKARYKNSVLGYIWSLLNPLLMMLVFWVVFSLLIPNGIAMFPVFLIVALLPWNFAVTAVSGGMRSILDNANLVKKVYFPREILPITVVLSNLVNYLFALPVLFLVMAVVQWFTLGRLNFSWSFAFLPVILVIQTIFLIGVALLLSTMAVFFRDTTHIVDIFIQLWIFLTPVFFSLEQIASPLQAKVVRWINPMASIIDFYRDILYGQALLGAPGGIAPIPHPGLPALDGVFRTLLTALVILAFGAFVFHRSSGRFGEEL